MPIFVIPLVGTFIVAGLIVWVVGAPIAGVMTSLTAWLTTMSTGNQILFAIVLGCMIAFDMGGPVNKVAYFFAVGLIGAGVYTIMGPVGAAICTPPLGMAAATFLAPKKYTSAERQNGIGSFFMGLIGITEGAIPYAAADPLRVIPSIMTGSAAAAVTAMLLGVGNQAPWGGLIVLPVIINPIAYVIAILVGVAVTAFMVNALKKEVDETIIAAASGGESDEMDINLG